MKQRTLRRLALFPSAVLASVPAMAAVPTEVTTAMADLKADALVVAGAFLVAIIAVAAFKFMKRGAS